MLFPALLLAFRTHRETIGRAWGGRKKDRTWLPMSCSQAHCNVAQFLFYLPPAVVVVVTDQQRGLQQAGIGKHFGESQLRFLRRHSRTVKAGVEPSPAFVMSRGALNLEDSTLVVHAIGQSGVHCFEAVSPAGKTV